MHCLRLDFSKFVTAVAALTVACCAANSAWSQTILYSDTFTRVEGSGDPNDKPAEPDNFSAWGDNDNGLGGTLVNTWLVGPERPGGANQVTDGERASTIEGSARYPVDITSMAPAGFQVDFDFSRFHPDNPPDPFLPGNGFVTIGFGTEDDDGQGGGAFNVNNADLTILFQQDADPDDDGSIDMGNFQVLEDSILTHGIAVTRNQAGEITDIQDPSGNGEILYGDPVLSHSASIVLVPAVVGAYGDSDEIDVSVAVDGSEIFTFTTTGGAGFGHVSLASNGFVHRDYDNLVVTALPSVGIPGDKNGDNRVDGEDLRLIQQMDPSETPTWEANYGTGVPSEAAAASVPEPGTLVLAALTAGWVPWRRRRA